MAANEKTLKLAREALDIIVNYNEEYSRRNHGKCRGIGYYDACSKGSEYFELSYKGISLTVNEIGIELRIKQGNSLISVAKNLNKWLEEVIAKLKG